MRRQWRVNARERFIQLASLADDAIDLAEAALVIAAETYAGLDIAAYLGRLGSLAAAVGPRLAACKAAPERIARLRHFLSVEQGFSGNREDYYDPRNSFLNEVLDRRTGIPITLSLVYMEVGRRAGLPIRGVGFPGHFLTKYQGDDEIIIDAFFGQVLSEDECRERLRAVLGPEVVFERRYLDPASNKEILARILGNLKYVYLKRNQLPAALTCAERILLLSPDNARELRDRGLIYQQLECHRAAAADLERFLELAPEDPSADAVREQLVALQRQAAQIH
jgi:regulator of sirC expression with transglutaminase-like and TPR domain